MKQSIAYATDRPNQSKKVALRRARLVDDARGELRLRLEFATEIGVADVYCERLPYRGVIIHVPAQPELPDIEPVLRIAARRVLDSGSYSDIVRGWSDANNPRTGTERAPIGRRHGHLQHISELLGDVLKQLDQVVAA